MLKKWKLEIIKSNWTVTQIAEKLGVTRKAVYDALSDQYKGGELKTKIQELIKNEKP